MMRRKVEMGENGRGENGGENGGGVGEIKESSDGDDEIVM